MKKLILTLIALSTVALLSNSAFAYPYIIGDGSVADWGINLSAAVSKYYLDTNLPSGGLDIDVKTEDNADTSAAWTKVYPGYSWYNHFDAEAMYFDNDQTNAYIAIVTGLTKEGIDPPGNTVGGNPNYKFKPGDIAIDANYDGTYEYGLNILDSKLYSVTAWNDAIYTSIWGPPNPLDPYNPFSIKTVSGIGKSVSFDYSTAPINAHYILEAKIPLSYLGLSANWGDPIQTIGIHWGMECGNDFLNLDADVNPVPEPTSMLLFGIGMVGMAATKLRKKKI